jgi:molybdopterin/thiamine biosynthesis adenylyltransferase/rhodanese-related sulfurtransferase
MALTPAELSRYSRHLMLPEIGVEGQNRLKNARVVIVGAGGLGSPAALYLAAAGVGTLGIVEFDAVDASNLHRQLLYGTSDVGKPKLSAARARIHETNPEVTVESFDARLSSANALDILRGFDVVVDGTDNFPTRYLLNDAAVSLGIPVVFGSVHRFEGQVSVFGAPDGPCYRCLFRDPPPSGSVPNCAEAGVLGVLPGLVGMIQATEVIKLVVGIGAPLIGRLLLVDALAMSFRAIVLRRDAECPACGAGRSPVLTDYDQPCATVESFSAAGSITPRELAERLDRGDVIDVVDVREPYEWAIAQIPGARLVPLDTIDRALDSFDRDGRTVLYCKSGLRSAVAAERLVAAGIGNVLNLSGGIMRWREEVDPTVPQY